MTRRQRMRRAYWGGHVEVCDRAAGLCLRAGWVKVLARILAGRMAWTPADELAAAGHSRFRLARMEKAGWLERWDDAEDWRGRSIGPAWTLSVAGAERLGVEVVEVWRSYWGTEDRLGPHGGPVRAGVKLWEEVPRWGHAGSAGPIRLPGRVGECRLSDVAEPAYEPPPELLGALYGWRGPEKGQRLASDAEGAVVELMGRPAVRDPRLKSRERINQSSGAALSHR